MSIPDATVRSDALAVLERKRTHVHGAALFCILPHHRDRNLLSLLVSYELIWDLLDNVSERAAAAGFTDGRALHAAIAEAIDPGAPITDYYKDLPWTGDGGYLRTLVETCRRCCGRLPAYDSIRDLTLADARLAQVLALNHEPNLSQRDATLRAWALRHFPHSDMPWWELSGAASAPLSIHALLALAAEPTCSETEIAAAHAAYFPWVSATTTMLDSYVDRFEDERNGAHSYVAHYPDAGRVAPSLQRLLRRSVTEVRQLERGSKHAIIVAAMAAMYLSKIGTLGPEARDLIRSGGSLTRLLLPALRSWRLLSGQAGV